MSEKYNPKIIEKKWQSYWSENKLFESKVNQDQEKYYILEMFPYPSGKIHMGHVRNYTLGDVIARFKRATGFNVMHPMGWDAFGLPAENAAIENSTSPKTWTYENISTMKNQLKQMGLSLDWSRELATCDEIYYHQQQKLFLKFYNDNLIYKKESLVNWDPVENTVLANEQVIDGKGWRSGADIEQKNLSQWFFKITHYAEELLNDLDKLELWPEKVKTMQRNWIGKSYGAEIKFKISGENEYLNIFNEVDLENTLSFTIPINLPTHGGGLYTWEDEVDPKLFNYTTNDTKLSELESPSVSNLYNKGEMVYFIGHLLHQMMPGRDLQPTDRRITVQGHGIKCDGVWRLYW